MPAAQISNPKLPLCVLGVDPAAAGATGYGVIESDGKTCRLLRFGALRPSSLDPDASSANLCAVHDLLSGLIAEFKPDGVAIEAVFSALNVKTALRLSEVRGVILLAAAQANVPSFSYSPRQVKATVAGYGHAGKEQVQCMVRSLLGIGEIPQPEDASDALAIALCHVQIAHFQARFGAQPSPWSGARRTVRRRNPPPEPRASSLR